MPRSRDVLVEPFGVRSQRLAILEYTREHGFHIGRSIRAKASGRATKKHRRLDDLMGELTACDRVVVGELPRLGRSLGEVIELLDAISRASIKFVPVKENIRFEGRQDLQTKVMTTLFALFAEVERELISARNREGLAKAKASGKKLGRPKGAARDVAAQWTRGRDQKTARTWRLEDRRGQDHRGVPTDLVQLSQQPRYRSIDGAGINRMIQLTATTPSGSKTTSPPK